MSHVLIIEPRQQLRWSPWSTWLGSDRGSGGRPVGPQRALKRHCLKAVTDCAKRPCCRQQERPVLEGFRQELDVAGYRPGEVHVRLSDDGLVTVSACRKERFADGFTHSRMVKRVNLPKSVQADKLTSRLTREGKLVLEAPPAPKMKKVVTIPVAVDGSALNVRQDDEKTEKAEVKCATKTDESHKGHEGAAEENVSVSMPDAPSQSECKNGGEEGSNKAEKPSCEGGESHNEPSADGPGPVDPEKSNDGVEAEVAKSDRQIEVGVGEAGDRDAKSSDNAKTAAVAVLVDGAKAECGAVSLPPSQTVTAGDGMFRVSVDVSDFRPDEVSVKVSGRQVAIEAEHEESAEGGSTVLRLARRLTLPEGVDPDLVTSRLTCRGQLVVEAPTHTAPSA